MQIMLYSSNKIKKKKKTLKGWVTCGSIITCVKLQSVQLQSGEQETSLR